MSGLLAITRPPTADLAGCALSHVERVPVDLALALAQHAGYEEALRALGCEVLSLRDEPGLPDAPFVEDVALALDEVAVATIPGADSRHAEVESVALALEPLLPVVRLREPARLDGGDVLRVGRTLFVGASSRTNAPALEQLAKLGAVFGYLVVPVALGECLHLKTAATVLGAGEAAVLLANPAWVDAADLAAAAGEAADLGRPLPVVAVDPGEPFAANALDVDGVALHPAEHVRTRARLERRGLRVVPVPFAELAKAEAGVTCCTILVRRTPD